MDDDAQTFARTSSGIPLKPVYGPQDRAVEPPAPGEFPFTRGNYASGYRGRLWPWPSPPHASSTSTRTASTSTAAAAP